MALRQATSVAVVALLVAPFAWGEPVKCEVPGFSRMGGTLEEARQRAPALMSELAHPSEDRARACIAPLLEGNRMNLKADRLSTRKGKVGRLLCAKDRQAAWIVISQSVYALNGAALAA